MLSKFKKSLLVFLFTLILFGISDLIFSNFIYKKKINLRYDCYEYIDHNLNGKYFLDYKLQKNCVAFEKQRTVSPYKVITDENGYRYSGMERSSIKENIVFLGDSFTYGLSVDYKNSFPGIIENKIDNYNYYNLGVPSYGIQKYFYTLNEFSKNNKISKIFLILDLTDVFDASQRWIQLDTINTPVLISKKTTSEISNWKKFKSSNFKGTMILIYNLRNLLREIKFLYKNNMGLFKKNEVESSKYAFFTYKNPDSKLIQKKDIKKGIKVIEENFNKISDISKKNNSELYLVIYPWPETLEFGQALFNWENFAHDLCDKNNCKKLINLFDDFRSVKKRYKNWQDLIYINEDVHLKKFGNQIIADRIIKEINEN